jgi:hypothetical protein
MSKLAQTLLREKDVFDASPILALQMLRSLLETHNLWRPYQAQITFKRYLPVKYGANWPRMTCPKLSTITLAGPGTLFFLRRLCPQGFQLLDRLEGNADETETEVEVEDEEEKTDTTVDGKATAGTRDFARCVLEMLVQHQDNMALHLRVNEVLGIIALQFDDMQNTVCEARGFTYSSRPRKDPSGFASAMRQVHRDWYLQSGWERCWSTIAVDASKRQKTL